MKNHSRIDEELKNQESITVTMLLGSALTLLGIFIIMMGSSAGPPLR